MKIQFEIKEKMPEIIKEVLHSNKWHSVVTIDDYGLKRVMIKDPVHHDSKAFVEIWEKEIHIKTAKSNHTYRIFKKENAVICEYFGAHCELLNQCLLPKITPLCELKKTIDHQKDQHINKENKRFSDEFIKNDMPIPSFLKRKS